MYFSFEWRSYAIIVWSINLAAAILAYWLHGAIIAFIPLFIAIFIGWGALIRFNREDGIPQQEMFSAPKSRIQTWGTLSLLYAGINFWVCMISLWEGQPHIDNGVYCLWNHGFVREITQAEYDALSLVEGRSFLGHLLAFSALAMMGFDKRKAEGNYPY